MKCVGGPSDGESITVQSFASVSVADEFGCGDYVQQRPDDAEPFLEWSGYWHRWGFV